MTNQSQETASKEQSDEFLRFKVLKGFRRRGLPMTQEYMERIEYEGQIIAQTGNASYFLFLADLCRFMRERRIGFVVPSGGWGSCYVWGLGISHESLDPIRLGLPFETVLNPARHPMPNLQVAIQDERFHEVLDYVVARYGWDRTARIISFGPIVPLSLCQSVARGYRPRALGALAMSNARYSGQVRCKPTPHFVMGLYPLERMSVTGWIPATKPLRAR